jgi:hypothetical protein
MAEHGKLEPKFDAGHGWVQQDLELVQVDELDNEKGEVQEDDDVNDEELVDDDARLGIEEFCEELPRLVEIDG